MIGKDRKMNKMKFGLACKRMLAFSLSAMLLLTFCGCNNVVKEQWDVVEQYRLENTTETTAENVDENGDEITTTEALPEQKVLADFMDYSADTLGERVKVPNGYVRVNLEDAEDEETADIEAEDTEATDAESTSESTSESTTEGSVNATVAGATTGASDSGTSAVTTEGTTYPIPDNSKGVTYSIEQFMRQLPVKKQNDKVKLYTGSDKEVQDSYISVLNMRLDDRSLQQRASSIMRLYSEFFWMNQDYDKLSYKIADGFNMEYKKWIEGNRVNFDGTQASWYVEGTTGDSYQSLSSFLDFYFGYSGMESLINASATASVNNIQVGDFFIDKDKQYAAMVVDVAENEDGNKCFLLASGGSPGQDIEILKNPAHTTNGDPWYYASEVTSSFKTPEFELDATSCYHLK